MKSSFRAFMPMALILTAGCSEDSPEQTKDTVAPTEISAPEETAEEAVRVIVNGLSEGNTGVLWAALPSGYQDDVNGLVRAFGNGMDPVQWGQIQGVVAKVHELLSTKSEFFANTSVVQGMVQSDQLQNVITQIAGILKILLDQTDLQSLQSFDGEAFFSGPASTMVSQMDVLSTLSPDGVSLSSLKEATIETIRTEGNKATLKVSQPPLLMRLPPMPHDAPLDLPPREMELVRVDGHWLPAELASDWDSNIAGAKAALAGLPATAKDSAMQVAMVTGMITSVLDPLQAAEDQEQFDAAVESLRGSLDGMLGPMFGGFGGGPFGADQEAESVSGYISLAPGSKAPAIDLAAVVHGPEVRPFSGEHVVVVEFWATWCGPCLRNMPHLSALQQQYGSEVQFIGVTDEDEQTVTEFLETEAEDGETWRDSLSYTIAVDRNAQTSINFMQAAQQQGIPCAFVINKAGQVAWIGHPAQIESPLVEIVRGTWDIETAQQQFLGAAELNDPFSFSEDEEDEFVPGDETFPADADESEPVTTE